MSSKSLTRLEALKTTTKGIKNILEREIAFVQSRIERRAEEGRSSVYICNLTFPAVVSQIFSTRGFFVQQMTKTYNGKSVVYISW